MNFDLSEEQQMLRDSALRYLGREYAFAARRRTAADGGFDAARWRGFGEMGWLAAPFPEAAGGLGGGPQAVMVLMEAFGRHLVLEPYLWTVVVGGQLLLQGAAAERREPWLAALLAGTAQWSVGAVEDAHAPGWARVATRAQRHGGTYRLSGAKAFAPNAPLADRIVVSARTAGGRDDAEGITLFAVDRRARGVTVAPFRTQDGQTAARVTLDDVAVDALDILGTPDQGLALLEQAFDHGLAAVCAEAIGSADRLIEATSTYLKTREQYGGPLSRLQVLQHRLADMYVAAEMSRSMTCVATLSLEGAAEPRARNASAARMYVLPAVRGIAQAAVQLHGGMGMSVDFEIGHHLARNLCAGVSFGDEGWHLDRYRQLTPRATRPAGLPDFEASPR